MENESIVNLSLSFLNVVTKAFASTSLIHFALCPFSETVNLGNNLEKALKKIKREDVVQKCMYNIMTVTDTTEREAAKLQLDQSGKKLDPRIHLSPYQHNS